jgi:hypothetical protein
MAPRFDRQRFAYELAQELGVDYARVPTPRSPDQSVAEVRDGIQATMEVGPPKRGDDGGEDVTYGAAAGLSTLNRARPTPVRGARQDEEQGEG